MSSGFNFTGKPAGGGTGGVSGGAGGFSLGAAGAKPTTSSISNAFGGGAKSTPPITFAGAGDTKSDAKTTPSALSFGAPSAKPLSTGGGFGNFNMSKASPKTETASDLPPPVSSSFGGGALTSTTTPAVTGFNMKPAAKTDTSSAVPPAPPVIGFGASSGAPTPSFGAPSSTVPATTTTAAPKTTAATGIGFGAGAGAGAGTSLVPAGADKRKTELTTSSAPSALTTTIPGTLTTATTATAGAATTTTATATMQDNPFSKMALQEVINKWKAELDEDIVNYQTQSERVKKWDAQLRENQKVLNNLVDTVHRLYVDQDDLATNIQQISEFQDDLDRDLNELSEQVDKELEKSGDLQPDEALYTREQIYTRATDLDYHLTQMHTNLETIVTDFNEARGGGEDDSKALEGTSDIGKILKVLNVHNDSLCFIESKSRQMKHDADALTRQMENVYSNSSAGANYSYGRY